MDRRKGESVVGDSPQEGTSSVGAPKGGEGHQEAAHQDPEHETVKPKGEWKYKQRFPIQDRMIEVIQLTKKAAESELEVLRKKLRKMQLGS